MSSTLTQKVVVGRRIIHDHAARKAKLPGIITRVYDDGGFRIRLDGDRHTFPVPPKFVDRVTFLDEVTEVPALPMGRFHPTVNELEGEWEGVSVCTVSEDGDLVLLTTDKEKAKAAATAYFRWAGIDLDYVNFDRLKLVWAVFEWEPEDADTDWTVRWDAAEGDAQAIRLYFLPA
ncbi:hypothetical protein [Streptomyces griseorubiginosus]|uniref:hypothetical protein n=1 Tax=Streptomyces griseorubiginosus TaxID=67304 RepID=UPI0033CB4445